MCTMKMLCKCILFITSWMQEGKVTLELIWTTMINNFSQYYYKCLQGILVQQYSTMRMSLNCIICAESCSISMGPKLEDFEVVSVVGTGTSGTVRKVRRRTDGRVLVWKELHYANMSEAEKQVNYFKQIFTQLFDKVFRSYDILIMYHSNAPCNLLD